MKVTVDGPRQRLSKTSKFIFPLKIEELHLRQEINESACYIHYLKKFSNKESYYALLYFWSKLKLFPFFIGENKLTCLTSWLMDSINSDFHTFGINRNLWRTCTDAKVQKKAFTTIIYFITEWLIACILILQERASIWLLASAQVLHKWLFIPNVWKSLSMDPESLEVRQVSLFYPKKSKCFILDPEKGRLNYFRKRQFLTVFFEAVFFCVL